jgi:acyl-CoA synthetase (AMP-forming)/AMP-acid ligase II
MGTATGVRLSWPDGDQLPEAQRAGLLGPGAPFELRDEAVLGATLPVFAQRPRDLRQLLVGAAERHRDRPYVVFPDRRYSFAEVLGPVAATAAALRNDFGVEKGDRVAIAAANCADYVITFWAATCLGAITVAMNGWWTGPELAYGVELTRPRVLFGDGRRLARISDRDVGVPVVEFGAAWTTDHPRGADTAAPALPDVALDEDDPFLILFTSGTTGRPKGALLSHRNNIHFLWSTLLGGVARNILTSAGEERQPQERQPPPPDPPCVIAASPLFHIAGLTAQVVLAVSTGLTIVYPPPGRWREEVHLALSQEHRATNWSLVPTQLWRILGHPDLERYDLTSLRSVGGGSSMWPPELMRLLGERLPWVRPALAIGYGMTETCGLGTSLKLPETLEHPDSVGQANPAVEVEVRDQATGEPQPEGVVGEVCLRTAATFLGYWDDPASTQAALDEERWYRTGDFGHIRDGLLYLEGRRSDLIIRAGENIYPAEIENRLVEHPHIADAAVIGIAHPTLGQEVKAVVEVEAGRALDADAVRDWVAAALAVFKVPAHVEFVDRLPRNAMGKVVKRLLEHPAESASFIEE